MSVLVSTFAIFLDGTGVRETTYISTGCKFSYGLVQALGISNAYSTLTASCVISYRPGSIGLRKAPSFIKPPKVAVSLALPENICLISLA